MKKVAFKTRIVIPAGIVAALSVAGLLGFLDRPENSLFDLFCDSGKNPSNSRSRSRSSTSTTRPWKRPERGRSAVTLWRTD
jgi:hypothetical protein